MKRPQGSVRSASTGQLLPVGPDQRRCLPLMAGSAVRMQLYQPKVRVDDPRTIVNLVNMARGPRRLKVDVGGFRAVKLGAPAPISDLYYQIMEMSWPQFVALVSAVFIAINLAFGLIYASLPGVIMNAVPGSVADGFFFSIETLATVGYGNMAPANHLGHSLAAIEVLLGLFFSATVTGLIFARFARPHDSLVFSRVAVVGIYEGRRALIVRVASTRARPLVNVTGQIAWLERSKHADGRAFSRLVDLPLVSSRTPMLGLAWTLVHLFEPESPVLDALVGAERFTMIATVGGIDTLLANQSQGGRMYQREDVLIDHEFIDVITDHDNVLHLDLARLHDAMPIPPG